MRCQPLLVVLAGGVALPIMIVAAGWLGGLRINITPSEPLGLWRIERLDRPLAVGDLVFICPPRTAVFAEALASGYLRRGLCSGGMAPLIKTVVAASGQSIEIGRDVHIDSEPLPHSTIRDVDAAGRPLHSFAGGLVPAGYLFLHSSFAGSYDSRYFGPVPVDGLLGLARPLFTFDP